MRFRMGMLMGFAGGYYLGAKAGRERYEQLNAMIAKVKRSDVYETASDKAKAVADLGVERAKEFAGEHVPHRGGNGHSAPGQSSSR